MRAEINKQYLKENKTYEKIKTLISKRCGLDILDIQPLGQGVGSIVLKVNTLERDFAIKICMYPERTEKVIGEFSIRKKMNKLGLDFVPKSLWIDKDTFEYGAVVFDYVDGISPDFSKKQNLSKLALTLSKIHIRNLKRIPDGYQVFRDHFNYLKNLVSKTITKYDYIINDDIKHGMELALAEFDNSVASKRSNFTHGLLGLCHDDVASNCIIDPKGKIWLVDWENSCVEDIIEEVVYTTFDLDLDENLKSYFFKAYQEAFPPAKDINFLEIEKIYLEMEPIFNLCWGLDFLDVNLRRNLQPEFYINELKKQIKAIKLKFPPEISDYFERGLKKIKIINR